jgi:hypothetical protein
VLLKIGVREKLLGNTIGSVAGNGGQGATASLASTATVAV